MRHRSIPDSLLLFSELFRNPRCISIYRVDHKNKLLDNNNSLVILTLFNIQIDHDRSMWQVWISNSLTNVFAAMFHANVRNFKTPIQILWSLWQSTTSSSPLDSGTQGTFVTALEDNFTTCRTLQLKNYIKKYSSTGKSRLIPTCVVSWWIEEVDRLFSQSGQFDSYM